MLQATGYSIKDTVRDLSTVLVAIDAEGGFVDAIAVVDEANSAIVGRVTLHPQRDGEPLDRPVLEPATHEWHLEKNMNIMAGRDLLKM